MGFGTLVTSVGFGTLVTSVGFGTLVKGYTLVKGGLEASWPPVLLSNLTRMTC